MSILVNCYNVNHRDHGETVVCSHDVTITSCGKSYLAELIGKNCKNGPVLEEKLQEDEKQKEFYSEVVGQAQLYREQEYERFSEVVVELWCRYYSESFEQIKSIINNWDKFTILYPITSTRQIEMLRHRNYFHLISIQTPVKIRYSNFASKYPEMASKIDLEMYCFIDDTVPSSLTYLQIAYHPGSTEDCMSKSNVSLENHQDKQQLLINLLRKSEDVYRSVRPSWDEYFMNIAHIVKTRSNCMKRAVGAVIVKDNRIIATGYNGTPNGKTNCFDGGCERCNKNTSQGKELEKCFCFHAEENAILEVGNNQAKGLAIYTTLFPCYQCSKILIAAVRLKFKIN